MKFTSFYFLLILGFLFQSCSHSRWDVDTSDVLYNGTILRLDTALFSNGGVPVTSDRLIALKSTYGDFLNMYLTDIMRVGPMDNPMTAGILNQFLMDPTWKDLEKVIEEKHPNLDSESNQLERAFKSYAVIFKEDTLPKIIAYNSGFNVGVYPTRAYLGVGLEWYSGGDLKIMDRLPPDLFPQYKRDRMQPRFLVPNALRGWLFVKHKSLSNGESLLNRMIFAGKIYYATHVLLPDLPEEQIMNYSPRQIDWCKNEEYQIWKYILDNDLIFSIEAKKVEKMMNDGPFTPGMPSESPGGVGNWIGYQMVNAFMDRNEKMTLPELFALQNDKVFLEKFKPGK